MEETSKKRKIFKICYIVCYLLLIVVASVLFHTALQYEFKTSKPLPCYIVLLVLGLVFCVRLFMSARKGKLLGIPKTRNRIYLLLGALLNAVVRSLILVVPLSSVWVLIEYCKGAVTVYPMYSPISVITSIIQVALPIPFIGLMMLYLIAYFIMPKQEEKVD